MKCLIYCTKSTDKKCEYHYHGNRADGKIVAEFDCDKVEEISNYGLARHSEIMLKELLEKSCLTMEQLNEYAPHKDYKENDFIYAIHISNLKVFDRPLELKDLLKYTQSCYRDNHITKAPQNMCYVWYEGELCVLISIQPQWVCKIENGEKKIEVRKQIVNKLKEVIV